MHVLRMILGKEEIAIEYTITHNSTGVNISCTFKNIALTHCLVIVHRQISQLSSRGLMNIQSYIFSRSGDIAYGFIPGVDLKHDQIGVVSGEKTMLHPLKPGSDGKPTLSIV